MATRHFYKIINKKEELKNTLSNNNGQLQEYIQSYTLQLLKDGYAY